jgi:hypothetical protein
VHVRRALALAALGLALTPAFAATAFAGPSPVLLGTAADFAVLGGSGLTNTGVSTIAGDIGSSPTHTEAGFTPCPAANCVSLTGTNHDVADPNDAVTQQAKDDLTTAYIDASGRTGGTAVSAPLGGGTKLVSGLYTAATDLFVGGDLTLDAGGDPDAVFIFQALTGTLGTAAGTSGGIPNTRVLLSNGAQSCNVFWQVGSSATIETATQFVGTILANQSITVNTGATLNSGRVLARNGAVTLDTNTIRRAPCTTPTTGAAATPLPIGGATTSGGTAVPTSAGASTPGTTATPAAKRPAGTAKLTSPNGTVSGPFTVSVTGQSIAKVTYYVDGKVVGTVRAKKGRRKFTLTIDPRGRSTRVHRVTARVTFLPGARTRTTKLHGTFRRPVPVPRVPHFTG